MLLVVLIRHGQFFCADEANGGLLLPHYIASERSRQLIQTQRSASKDECFVVEPRPTLIVPSTFLRLYDFSHCVVDAIQPIFGGSFFDLVC